MLRSPRRTVPQCCYSFRTRERRRRCWAIAVAPVTSTPISCLENVPCPSRCSWTPVAHRGDGTYRTDASAPVSRNQISRSRRGPTDHVVGPADVNAVAAVAIIADVPAALVPIKFLVPCWKSCTYATKPNLYINALTPFPEITFRSAAVNPPDGVAVGAVQQGDACAVFPIPTRLTQSVR